MIRPQYAEAFRCLGGACEDTLLHRLARGHRSRHIRQVPDRASRPSPCADGGTPGDHSGKRRNPKRSPSRASRCPPRSSARSSTLVASAKSQVEHGARLSLAHLLHVSAQPVHHLDAMEDKTLTLSCPEAAPHRAAQPQLPHRRQPARPHLHLGRKKPGPATPRSATQSAPPPYAAFSGWFASYPSNSSATAKYPLWQRMFLLGTLARRLEAQVSGEIDRAIPDLAQGFFRAAVSTGKLRAVIDTIPRRPGPATRYGDAAGEITRRQ